ncbi:hypothetical protein ANI02nite_10670 [Acetobacter nitrogenifigens DSM 23921 = NBRC 105050]|uniref:Uncharacterized protein n=1 Tax=Acetobacter nitrogenifigens DSM 23921 = NBRC 105050 TaxID=1120919 RepID=A0A511X8B4_9PROT|nr:hypothetical protein ANI02nite_10670 [Acetobacter nitrogenifigens DSM 23921 = NBRC 105050]
MAAASRAEGVMNILQQKLAPTPQTSETRPTRVPQNPVCPRAPYKTPRADAEISRAGNWALHA